MLHPFHLGLPRFTRFWRLSAALVISLRLAHVNLLWSDEDYHLAAAIQLWRGRLPYAGFWYDKPPLAALYYALIGGYSGWPLRLLDIFFVAACCWFAYHLAARWWSEREGRAAALLLAFFTTFYLPSATIPFAVDALLLLPHLAAIHFAKQQRPFACGVACALGLLTNVKAVFVAVTCALWLLPEWPLLIAGFSLPLALAAAAGAYWGLLPDFYRQVWQWGLVYARGEPAPHAVYDAVRRITDWLAFHLVLLVGLIAAIRSALRRERLLIATWLTCSAVSLFFGNHFAPRYFLQMLPVMVIAGSRGIVLLLERHRRPAFAILLAMLMLPVARFGPRYIELLVDAAADRSTRWSDAAMDIDSRQVASLINARKHAGDTLFVWGYRPDVYVYTRLTPAGKFWDSQPLDGVPADRHLHSSKAVFPEAAAQNRRQLVDGAKPTFVVDGLGLLNPDLSPQHFPEIAAWLADYSLLQQTRLSRVYRLKQPAGQP